MARVRGTLIVILAMLLTSWLAISASADGSDDGSSGRVDVVTKQIPPGEPSPGPDTDISFEDYFLRKAELEAMTNTMVKRCLHNVQLSVERCSVDQKPIERNGQRINVYPGNIGQLITGNYIDPGYYANPATASSVADRNARCVSLGPWSEDKAGNFSYVAGIGPSNQPEMYMLVGYGTSPTATSLSGIPGVVIILTSGYLTEEWKRDTLEQLRPAPASLVSLDVLIQQTFRK